MISERQIAEKFTTIWKQHFPLLTPQFMRVFNESRVQMANESVLQKSENVRYDIVSELAFNITALSFEKELPVDQVLNDKDTLKKLTLETARAIWKSGNYSGADLVLRSEEIVECQLICDNTVEFVNLQKNDEVTFKPVVKGYGFLTSLVADLTIDDTLYEVKTVNRNFRSSDLKQLLIYLALQQVTGTQSWKFGGLYNPRTGTYCKFNVKGLVYNLSGGKSPNEVFESLLNNLTRDIQIDSRF
jgi:hypothetical protein